MGWMVSLAIIVRAREGTERFEQHQAFDPFRKGSRIEQTHTAAERMTDDRYRIALQVLEQSSEIGQEILVLVAAAMVRPFALAVTAQIERDGMFDWNSAGEQGNE